MEVIYITGVYFSLKAIQYLNNISFMNHVSDYLKII